MSVRAPLPRTLLGLTFVTGMLDAIAFLGLADVFVGMMTGSVLFLGFGVAGAAGASAAAPAVALAAFLAGGGAGGLMASRGAPGRAPGLGGGMALEVALVGGAAVIAVAAGVSHDSGLALVLVGMLAFAMGARNTIVRRIGVPELPTLILTVALTSFQAGTSLTGASPEHLVPRAAAIAAMLCGAIAGALLIRASLEAALAGAAAVAAVVAMAHAVSGPGDGATALPSKE